QPNPPFSEKQYPVAPKPFFNLHSLLHLPLSLFSSPPPPNAPMSTSLKFFPTPAAPLPPVSLDYTLTSPEHSFYAVASDWPATVAIDPNLHYPSSSLLMLPQLPTSSSSSQPMPPSTYLPSLLPPPSRQSHTSRSTLAENDTSPTSTFSPYVTDGTFKPGNPRKRSFSRLQEDASWEMNRAGYETLYTISSDISQTISAFPTADSDGLNHSPNRLSTGTTTLPSFNELNRLIDSAGLMVMLFEKAQTKVSIPFVIVNGKYPSVVGRSNPPFSVHFRNLQLDSVDRKLDNQLSSFRYTEKPKMKNPSISSHLARNLSRLSRLGLNWSLTITSFFAMVISILLLIEEEKRTRPAPLSFLREHGNTRITTEQSTVPCAEWRKGPLGPRTLCNACGLIWAKLSRKKAKDQQQGFTLAEQGAAPMENSNHNLRDREPSSGPCSPSTISSNSGLEEGRMLGSSSAQFAARHISSSIGIVERKFRHQPCHTLDHRAQPESSSRNGAHGMTTVSAVEDSYDEDSYEEVDHEEGEGDEEEQVDEEE
ncbi:hypothetical protein BC937DRAFT_91228, partial [Endogone sp. FLAS-F59071]